MKKLLYAIPLILIILCLTPLNLYHDKVDLLSSDDPYASGKTDQIPKLTPSIWQTLHYSFKSYDTFMQINSTPKELSYDENDQIEVDTPREALYVNAVFHGFPFAAYFSKEDYTFDSSNYPKTAMITTGYSWQWALLDLLIIISAAVLAFKLNQKHP